MLQVDVIRTLLYEGPSTANELGASSGLGTQQASAYLCTLRIAGEAEVIGHIGTGTRMAGIYALTSKGAARVRAEDRARIDAERFARDEAEPVEVAG